VSVIGLIVVLVVAGVVVWLLNALVPMDPKFKMVVNAVIGVALFLYVLSAFGLIGAVDFGGRVPRVR
jgi:hypothetical protein